MSLSTHNRIESRVPQNEENIKWWGKELSMLAHRAMLEEVRLTPKPGLVDCNNSGSHNDMDILMFIHSANVVSESLAEFVYLGFGHGNASARLTLHALRSPGLACEQAMYHATNGVNTHKGAIFAFGLLCAGAGRLLARNVIPDAYKLCQEVADICQGVVTRELASTHEAKTAGERFYKCYGLTGARGEAESGFATVLNYSLPTYYTAIKQGWSMENALHQALLTLIAHNEDTNLVSRGGINGLRFAQNEAMALLNAGGMANQESIDKISALDNAFITKNLSPGGSADLLAVTWFLAHLPSPWNNHV
ncbi:triphosphoribosyl-dephospho-CoA synthase CitG [Citrobacter portucalensis]|uniref:triphosphoribosyl-dephospho-CoA synthase CitG n=1 Tax=Citrobacter portucalensis TaxID=1639133 RepID=UPI002243E00C|nr:triphosphoribosyl-dephospho-CoA synthase CitG [Citrobacter portucalensis]MCW8353795.1 triphosphoribosyl-dephospho-CoA synthase CitG [Citrobacter portucalensis]MCX8992104.1 triphosphoribosyl-dephospho-CoA synthase CitG [Citrobacter portucalensis]MCX9006318.1 triphosphoribosyl-dephospho-CoA synthase CitG [Citrobacter portucalensis]MCX9039146.1 triphosphoribosyl-dephospho-CoA synthase CitG [Citrobacter portucalensis]MCX9053717.1 triphosphoribosyl-dephospho-CoA synthase CitG [Citrobacter portuc